MKLFLLASAALGASTGLGLESAADLDLDQFSVDDVQGLLSDWHLDHAFGNYFRRLSVDGDMLINDLEPEHINLAECEDATDAHVSKLFRKLDELYEEADEHRRLAGAKGISGAGLYIASDEGYVAMGSDEASYTVIQRQDDASLNINQGVSIDGMLNVGTIDGIEVTNIDDTTVSYFEQTNDVTVFLGEEPVDVGRGIPMTQTFTTSADYELSFDLKPTGTVGSWSNVIHLTESGSNCCNYGDRIPAVYVYAGTSRLHIIAGTNSTGNANFNPTDELPMNCWTTVTMRVIDDEGRIYYNDTYKGSIATDERMPHDNVQVWASDPWHKPAPAMLRNFKYRRASYHHANFYNDWSSLGDYEVSIESRLEDVEDFADDAEEDIVDLQTRLAAVEKSVLCSLDECCADEYEWDGDTLYCWSSHFDDYDSDPCSCYAEVHNLGSSTAYQHELNCLADGAHLMSFHSSTAVAAVAAYKKYFWIGLHDVKDEGNFRWFDGSTFGYDAWNTNEPNDSNGEDCVHTTTSNYNLWNDQDCDEYLTHYGICLFQ